LKPILLSFVLGPLENNTYVLADPVSRAAVVIDPSYESHILLKNIRAQGLRLEQVWLTHAHFDHIAGVSEVCGSAEPALPVALHPAELDMYQRGGGAAEFGMPFDPAPAPQVLLADGQDLWVGRVAVKVLHTPGHTPGHVIFYCAAAGAALVGDVIFMGSVGRTDLPGGSHSQLMASIRRHVLTLPPETVLLSGHGPETNVADEAATNPYL